MTELKPFQLKGARAIYQFKGRALLADEQGLGKTIQSLFWVMKCAKRRPVVIVTPASVKYAWQAEAALHFDMRAEVIEGHRKKRYMSLPGDVVILNYDILASWLPALKKAKPHIVIFDECHYIKNPDAKRTKAAQSLAADAPSVLGLSGTPLTNRPIELWPILNIIRPDMFPERGKYAWRYCKPRYTPWGWQYDGATRMPELHRILKEEVMIRRLKSEVMTELSPKIRTVVPFKLAAPAQREYDKAQGDFLGWLKEISPAKAKKAKKSEALVKIGYLLRLAAKLKLSWTTKWVEEFLESHPDKKLITFTGHTFVIDHLAAKFKDKCVIINGSVTGRKRDEAVHRFRSNKDVRLLLGNWIAAGVGLNLQAAHNVAGLDFPWTPGDMAQGEDRIHRIGQDMQCYIHYLVALGTIEAKQVKVLRKKGAVLGAVLDGKPMEGRVDMFTELMKEITK